MLEGLRIVEYATYVAAPGAGGVMADWGADVIKVEPPGGDPIRMFFSSLGVEEASNPVFDMDNRGKRGIILDTTQEVGREALLKLIDGADVFLTNVRPGGLQRAGLDHETILKRCPRLIYAILTGYGLEGAEADRPGMDSAAFWARSGLAAMFRPKGGDPVQLRTAFGDHVASLAIVGAILAALYERQSTGIGRLVEASLLRVAHYVGGSDLAIQHTRGRIASNRARADVPNPLINYFKTQDDHWISLLQRQGEKDWPKLTRALGLEHLVDDPRFANNRARRENGAELVGLMDTAFSARPLADVAAALDAEEMVWAPILTPAEAIADPQARAAGCIVQTPTHDGGSMPAPAAPVRFPGADDGPKGPSPRLGEHTRAILGELGYSEGEIDALYASGAAA
ncbi:MAG TPA: CaiB/BaiF CoA-transferase family protein [Vitreimonas sp.]|uniref:CaiB/BaiF CoA transferase family protein n=1 Tax=Vitreimonas sp. TaxID=3069702 RepID=UPI002D3B96F5|nr:CaiB/BaiF CoA-transferase family protein [Vitreimonas sp.]HYD88291.1 CaiB/BaiF CoA-transferase family protein [Vitreimonas sp.]